MEIENICEIIEEFSRDYSSEELNTDFFSDFVNHNDIGIPLAQCIVYKLATPTDIGKQMIIDTWNNLCEILEVDPTETYQDLDDMFDQLEEDDD